VAVLDVDGGVALELNDTTQLPDCGSLGPLTGEDEEHNVVDLCRTTLGLLASRHQQMDSINEDGVPLLHDAAIPLQLALGAKVEDHLTFQLAEVVPSQFQTVWCDDVPAQVSWSS